MGMTADQGFTRHLANDPEVAPSGPAIPVTENTGLWNQLANTVCLAAKQDQVVWAIFGVFWAANAVLLVALFTTGQLPERVVGIVVSGVGTVLSFLWCFVQRRALRFLMFYEEVMNRLERRLLSDALDVALSGRLNENLFRLTVGEGFRVRSIMIRFGIGSVVGWYTALLYFLIRQ